MTGRLVETMDFDGLTIAFDHRVLRPRAWTTAQSGWAADLLTGLPEGPVLELCCGAGQIGLAAVANSGRALVAVDLNPAAVELTELNARSAGIDHLVATREGRLGEAVRKDELFALVIADPPWVETSETSRYPEDPVEAIDGGHDGLAVARECLRVIDRHLVGNGAALLQLGSADQVTALMSGAPGSLTCVEVRAYDGGVVAHLTTRTGPRSVGSE